MAYASIRRLKSIHDDIEQQAKRLLVGTVSPQIAQSAQRIKNLCSDLDRAIRDAEREMSDLED